jgi:hypothetical protein
MTSKPAEEEPYTLPWAAESSFQIAKVERGNPCSSNAPGASFGPASRYKDIEIADFHCFERHPLWFVSRDGTERVGGDQEGENQISFHRSVHNCTWEKCVVYVPLSFSRPDRSKLLFQVRYAKMIAATAATHSWLAHGNLVAITLDISRSPRTFVGAASETEWPKTRNLVASPSIRMRGLLRPE